MNVLMYTNYPPYQLQDKSFVNEGWVRSIQDEIKKRVTLHIAYPCKEGPVFKQLDEHTYSFGYSEESDIKNYEYIRDIDVVHIMGTEFEHSLHNFNVCKALGLAERTVVSIQGLVSFCARHYLFGVPEKYQNGHSLVEVYAGRKSLKKDVANYEARGIYETELLKKCVHVIGRTDWDYRCVKSINPKVQYHYNSENLRQEFYTDNKWDLSSCEKYSIFISQATYCLKGFHHLLSILPEVIKYYPETKVYVGGSVPISPQKWKRNSYSKFLVNLIEKGKIEDHIVFCGSLSASQMRDRYLKSHVFLSPSNIENSSNSIGEAMILGVPTVASNVGGTDCIVQDGIDGLLYPITESYIMVEEIKEIFANEELANQLSKNAIANAQVLHDRKENADQLLRIYEEMLKEK